MESFLQLSRTRLLLCLGLCAVPLYANSQIYKCVDPKTGAKTYSSIRCSNDDQATTIATSARSTPNSSLSGQASLRSHTGKYREVQVESSTGSVSTLDPTNRSEPSHDKSGSIECEQARRKLAVRNSRVTRFSSDAREPAIDIYAACGILRPASRTSNLVGGTAVVDLPIHLVNCDPSGCWDTHGRRYSRAGDTLHRPDGGVCTRSGTQWVCP